MLRVSETTRWQARRQAGKLCSFTVRIAVRRAAGELESRIVAGRLVQRDENSECLEGSLTGYQQKRMAGQT